MTHRRLISRRPSTLSSHWPSPTRSRPFEWQCELAPLVSCRESRDSCQQRGSHSNIQSVQLSSSAVLRLADAHIANQPTDCCICKACTHFNPSFQPSRLTQASYPSPLNPQALCQPLSSLPVTLPFFLLCFRSSMASRSAPQDEAQIALSANFTFTPLQPLLAAHLYTSRPLVPRALTVVLLAFACVRGCAVLSPLSYSASLVHGLGRQSSRPPMQSSAPRPCAQPYRTAGNTNHTTKRLFSSYNYMADHCPCQSTLTTVATATSTLSPVTHTATASRSHIVQLGARLQRRSPTRTSSSTATLLRSSDAAVGERQSTSQDSRPLR